MKEETTRHDVGSVWNRVNPELQGYVALDRSGTLSGSEGTTFS